MPTFGYETIGASNDFTSVDGQSAGKFLCGDNFMVESISAYMTWQFATGEFVRFTLYSDDGGTPSHPLNLLGYTSTIEGTDSDGWVQLNLLTPVAVTSGTYYWLGIHSDSLANFAVDAGSFGDHEYQLSDTFSDGPVDPWVASGGYAEIISIYAQGTASGGGDSGSSAILML